MSKFKVLLVYPNLMMVTQLPNNIALLAAILKQNDIDVKLFDTTLYKTSEKTVDEMRVERLQVRKFNINDCGVAIKENNIYTEFQNMVDDYHPDLICLTVLDDTVNMAIDLISSLENRPVTLFGGIYAIFNYNELIQKKEVDYICIGEGDETIVEVCNNLKNKKSLYNVDNLCFKINDRIIVNHLRKPVDINLLPIEDFTIFEHDRLYRPMQGKMVSSLPLLFERGCPYTCSFCNANSLLDLYKNNNYRYFRQKSIDRIEKEIKYLLKVFPDVSYFYFNSETFLNRNVKQLKEFVDMYKKYNLPFWCQSRIETITEDRIKLLKEVNINRMSIGLEHGNYDFRKKILNKSFKNEQVIKAFEILNKYDIKTSVNNVIGFPDETRELVFDTIELNRQIKCDSINGFVFQPYRGTSLRDYCIKKGYLKDLNKSDNLIGDSILEMPQLTKKEIDGLLKTFVMYIKFPKKYYPDIKIAENNDEKGKQMFETLKKKLYKYYFN